jgi:hypothetical protein
MSTSAGPDQATNPSPPMKRALSLVAEECLAVVELAQEVHLGAGGLDRVEQAERRRGQPPGQWAFVEDVVGDKACDGDDHLLGNAERGIAAPVDGGTERHDALQVARAPVGRGLVAEHAALAVPTEMHRTAGGRGDEVDGVAHGHHIGR